MGMFDDESLDAAVAGHLDNARRAASSKAAELFARRARYHEIVRPILQEAAAALNARGVPVTLNANEVSGWALSGRSYNSPDFFLSAGGVLYLDRNSEPAEQTDEFSEVPYYGDRWDLAGDRPKITWSVPDEDGQSVYLDEELRERMVGMLVAAEKRQPGSTKQSQSDDESDLYATPEFVAALKGRSERERLSGVVPAAVPRKKWWRR
jgi:hypothetical protein